MEYKKNMDYRKNLEAMLIAQIPGNAISKLLYPDFEEMAKIASLQFKDDISLDEWSKMNTITCQICLETIDSIEYAKNCIHDSRHVFHVKCMNTWLNKKTNCPICRRSQIYLKN